MAQQGFVVAPPRGRIVVASPLQTRGSAGVITRGRVIVPPPNNRAFSSPEITRSKGRIVKPSPFAEQADPTKVCTSIIKKDVPFTQKMYTCATCDIGRDEGICQVCRKQCHKDCAGIKKYGREDKKFSCHCCKRQGCNAKPKANVVAAKAAGVVSNPVVIAGKPQTQIARGARIVATADAVNVTQSNRPSQGRIIVPANRNGAVVSRPPSSFAPVQGTMPTTVQRSVVSQSSYSPNGPVVCGWVKKKGRATGKFRMRFLLLEGSNLFYFEGDPRVQRQRSKNVINISEATVTELPTNSSSNPLRLKVTPSNEHRALVFSLPTREKLNSWFTALSKATELPVQRRPPSLDVLLPTNAQSKYKIEEKDSAPQELEETLNESVDDTRINDTSENIVSKSTSSKGRKKKSKPKLIEFSDNQESSVDSADYQTQSTEENTLTASLCSSSEDSSNNNDNSDDDDDDDDVSDDEKSSNSSDGFERRPSAPAATEEWDAFGVEEKKKPKKHKKKSKKDAELWNPFEE